MNQTKNIGKHKHNLRCRFCLNDKIETVIDFGNVPLAGGFFDKHSTPKDFRAEKRFPLRIAFCDKCYLLQVTDVVDSLVLYKDYFYFSSAIGTLVNHFCAYAKELKAEFPDSNKKLIVEIGCNDGVFLKPLKKEGFKVVGVDLAKNVVEPLIIEGYDIVVDFFGEKSAKKILNNFGKADVIVSSNSFAHIDDMHDVMKGIKLLLSDDGILIVEVHYLGTLIEEIQYDMMYHDHESYYSLLALENFFKSFDMEVYDVKPISIHAGSMRYYIQNSSTGKKAISKNVPNLRNFEKKMKLHKLGTYKQFFSYVKKTKRELVLLLTKLKKQGKKIAGYGASGRATAIMSFCDIDNKLLDYMIDDAPAKLGAYTPGNHLQIQSSAILEDRAKSPDYCLIFAWAFIEEIRKKKVNYLNNGGKFILPLPKVKIISS